MNIGVEIRRVLDESGMSVANFARRINTSAQNAQHIFARESVDTELLLEISKVLKYDFFQLYKTSAQLPEVFSEPKSSYSMLDKILKEDVGIEFLRDFIAALQRMQTKLEREY